MIVISARTFPSKAEPRDLDEALLWNCELLVAPDDNMQFDLTFNDLNTESRTVSSDEPRSTVLFEDLHIFENQSARLPDGTLVKLFLERNERFDLGGSRATFAEHFAAFFQQLFRRSPFPSQPVEVRIYYSYRLADQEVRMPVVLLARQDISSADHALFEQIAGALHQWLDTIQPGGEDGRIILDLTCWPAVPNVNAPLVKLSNVSLSMSDVIL